MIETAGQEHERQDAAAPVGPGGLPDAAARIAEVVAEKGATEIVALQVGAIVAYTDALMICTARNERMAGAIADEVRYRLKHEREMLPRGSDGAAATGWQVMDYGDCVLHIFTADARDRYRLEDLWRDAPRIEFPESLRRE